MIFFLISSIDTGLLGLEFHIFSIFFYAGLSWSYILSHGLIELTQVDLSFLSSMFFF